MNWSASVPLALAALLIEAICGYPAFVFRAFGHPVTWIGRLIGFFDRRFNREQMTGASRRLAGLLTLLGTLMISAGLAVISVKLVAGKPLGWLLIAILASTLLAQRSLHRHVSDVSKALSYDDVGQAREAVGHIVGRDVNVLDRAGIARAAIESLAENFSDGIVAPAFWIAVGGLPGGILYKAANTADSMIGHLSERYRAFGWAAARFDDLVNLPASRLAALWLWVASLTMKETSPGGALRAVWRDAAKHRSPNAGWPEAAMAGALDLSLGGPRVYDSEWVDDAYMGRGARSATAHDVERALDLYRRACVVHAIVLALLSLCLIPRH